MEGRDLDGEEGSGRGMLASSGMANVENDLGGIVPQLTMMLTAGPPHFPFLLSSQLYKLFVAVCRRLLPFVPEPTEDIPPHNSKMLSSQAEIKLKLS